MLHRNHILFIWFFLLLWNIEIDGKCFTTSSIVKVLQADENEVREITKKAMILFKDSFLISKTENSIIEIDKVYKKNDNEKY